MQNIKKNSLITASVCALVIGVISFFGRDAQSIVENNNDLVINTLHLKEQHVDIASKYVGYVVPIKSVNVMANVSGYIDEIWAEGGNNVKLGDNLLLIDQKQYKSEVEAQKAAKAMAYAEFVNAKNYYNRIKNAGKKAISASQIDEAKANFLAAEAKLKQTEAELNKASLFLDYTVLQASINGVLGDVNLTKGNFVSAGQTKLFTIVQQNPIRVKFAIPDKDYIHLLNKNKKPFENATIKLILPDNSTYKFDGKFAYFDNVVDKQTASINVFADFDNPDNLLVANSYVEVIVEQKYDNVFLIKQNYTKLENDGAFVNLVSNNKLKSEKLNIIGYYNNDFVVNNKFAKGDHLVISDITNINKNTKIKFNPISSDAKAK